MAYAAALGVLIDLDHFLIARINAGDWRAVRACLRDPRIAVLDQGAIFEAGEVGTLERLLSHAAIVGVAVPGTWFVDPGLGIATAVVLYVHVLTDLAWDVARQPRDRATAA